MHYLQTWNPLTVNYYKLNCLMVNLELLQGLGPHSNCSFSLTLEATLKKTKLHAYCILLENITVMEFLLSKLFIFLHL